MSKTNDEQKKRYAEAMVAAEKQNLLINMSFNTSTLHDKCGQAVQLYTLEGIDAIQREELLNNPYNPYPATEYVLLADKTGPKEKPSKSKITSIKTQSTPASKLPIKRGQKQEADPEESADSEVEADDDEEEKQAVSKVAPQTEKSETKKASKKSIVSMNKPAKTALGYILARFVDELYSTEDGQNVKSDEDFTKFVMTRLSDDLKSRISRVIVSSVNRLQYKILAFGDHNFNKDIADKHQELFAKENRPLFTKFINVYILKFFKLIGMALAMDLWSEHKTITPQRIERALRVLNVGNFEYMRGLGYTDGDSDFGLTSGFLADMRAFTLLVNPELPKKPKTVKKAVVEKKVEDAVSKPTASKPTTDKTASSTDKTTKDDESDPEDSDDAESDSEPEDTDKKPIKKIIMTK